MPLTRRDALHGALLLLGGTASAGGTPQATGDPPPLPAEWSVDRYRTTPPAPGRGLFLATESVMQRGRVREAALLRLDPGTGDVLWEVPGHGFSSPTVAGDKVFAGTADGGVRAVTTDGAPRWSQPLAAERPVWTPPAVTGETVVAAVGGDAPAAAGLAVTDGSVQWTTPVPAPSHGRPAVADGTVYLPTRGGLVALAAADGAVRWAADVGGAAGAPTVVDGMVYVGSDAERVVAIDAATGDVTWRAATRNAVRTAPRVADGLVVAGCRDYRVYGLDRGTGDTAWTTSTGNTVTWGPVPRRNGWLVLVGGRHVDPPAYREPTRLVAVDAAGDAVQTWQAPAGATWVAVQDGVAYLGAAGGVYRLEEGGDGA